MAHGQGLCCHRKLHCVGQVCPRQQRKLPTRTDKLAANYLAYVRLASIRQWLAAFPYEAECFRRRNKTSRCAINLVGRALGALS
jgi:hypothetical protein